MSAWERVTVICSKCGTEYQETFLVSWNSVFGEIPKKQIKCPKCGKPYMEGEDTYLSIPYPKRVLHISVRSQKK